MKQKNMFKKILTLLFFTLVSCGGNENNYFDGKYNYHVATVEAPDVPLNVCKNGTSWSGTVDLFKLQVREGEDFTQVEGVMDVCEKSSLFGVTGKLWGGGYKVDLIFAGSYSVLGGKFNPAGKITGDLSGFGDGSQRYVFIAEKPGCCNGKILDEGGTK